MRYKVFYVLILFTGLSFTSNAQLEEKEAILNDLLTELRSSREDAKINEINTQFKEELKMVLSLDEAFDYPFNSLKTVGKIYSQDKLLRIISWNTQREDYSNQYFAFILRKDARKDKIFVTELHEQKTPFGMVQYETITDENWYGALYYQIIDVKKGRRTFYTLLGYNANNERSTIKLIDVLYFKGTQPNFGFPLFETNNGTEKRVVFEYSKQAVMSLKYESKRSKIIFDHLSPESPSMKDFKEFYVPDLSYDAYEWNGKIWALEEDIIALNKKDSSPILLKAYDSKSGEDVSVPIENKWVNPENPNAPIDGGKHQAIIPDDIIKTVSSKKSKKKKSNKKVDKTDFKGVSYTNIGGKKNRRRN